MTDPAHLRSIAGITRGDASAVVVTRSCMTAVVRGETGPDRLNAFISYDHDDAVAQAERVDSARRDGRVQALAGVPVAVKDNICTLGLPTTCASRMLGGYRSPYEATVVRRLRYAGAVIVGKTNLDEFAMGSSTETSAFGATRNPHDHSRVPGGSSGGSAAAVAAGMVPLALGSDTGGSVRQPAAFCGVVGIRPTYGRVSRYGLVAFASSLDQIGVFGRSVADAALLLEAISGGDRFDATAERTDPGRLFRSGVDPTGSHRGDIRTVDADRRHVRTDEYVHAYEYACVDENGGVSARPVVGVPHEYFPDELHPGMRGACERALDTLRDQGCTVRAVSLPHTRYGIPAYAVIAAAEASTNLARFDGIRFGARRGSGELYEAARTAGFGAEVKRRIMLGTFVLSAGHHEEYYAAAQRVRAFIAHDFARVFADGIDVLFTPTTPTPAFRIGGRAEPYEMYASDVFTAPSSLAGLPALSVPIGTAAGLPVGGQLIAPPWREDVMIAAAALLERGTAA